jgi:hypothetical protein
VATDTLSLTGRDGDDTLRTCGLETKRRDRSTRPLSEQTTTN